MIAGHLESTDTLKPPVMTSLKYTIGKLYVAWDPQTFTDFVVTVESKSGSTKINQPATGNNTTIDKTLDPNDTFTVYITAMQDGNPGPKSTPRTAIIALPVYNELKYAFISGVGNLSVKWSKVNNAESYITTISAKDGSYKTNIPSVDPNCNLAKNLISTVDYNTISCGLSKDGVVIGPTCDPLTAIVAQPAVNTIRYSLNNADGNINVSWGAARNADQYYVRVKADDGSFDHEFPSTELQTNIKKTLDPLKTYKITVAGKAKQDIVQGPVSDEFTPIAEAPKLTLISYSLTDGKGILSTSWGDVNLADGYVITIKATDGSYLHNIPVTDITYDFEKTLDESKTYNVMVTATASSGIVSGPVSIIYTTIIWQVERPMLNHTGAKFIANWSIPAKLTGKNFECGLYKSGTLLNTETVAANKAEFIFSLDDATIYAAQIRAIEGIVKGPCTPLIQGPYSASLVYAYDPLARLTSVTWDAKTVVNYTFDNPGNITAITIAPVTQENL